MTRFTPLKVTFIAVSIATAIQIARADENTGLSATDTKELIAYTEASAPPQPPSDQVSFVPMPTWARGVLMPPMPDVLKPMGAKKAIIPPTKPTPAPVSLTPPADAVTTEHTVAGGTAPAKPAETPAMITVSPFLQWVQANPQAAAEQARQQAGAYQNPAAQPPTANANGANTASGPVPPNSPAPAPNGGNPNPYWLPPLIDSSNIAPPAVVGGSAAIYSQPQR